MCRLSRSVRLHQAIALVVLFIGMSEIHAAEDISHWWNGFSVTPGVGARHLGLDVTRKSDGAQGNISQDGMAQLFASLSVSTPIYKLDDSNWGIAVRMYSSFVTLDSQWYDYHTTNTSTGASQGERVDVGTDVSGHYTYIIPTLAYSNNGMAATFGIGLWEANFDGDIILTHDKNPVAGMPRDSVSFSTFDTLAYIVTLSYTSPDAWIFEMTVGGTRFSDNNYDYELEEVSMTVGKTFTF